MSPTTNRLTWAASGFILACAGLVFGNSLRDKYDRGINSLMPSEMYASTLASRDDTILANGIPANVYFDEIRRLLLNEYVDPINDETPLARGAVQYMLQDLGDTQTRFYEPEQWRAYVKSFDGHYDGIGANIDVRPEVSKLGPLFPLRVVSLADGGPAAKAGLKAGDWIDEINGKWVASRSLFRDFELAAAQLAKKTITTDQLEKIKAKLLALSERTMTVFDAMDELQVNNGPIKLRVKRGTQTLDFSFTRGPSDVAPIEEVGDTIRIRSFNKDVPRKLAEMIQGKKDVKLDIRGNPGGPLEYVNESLAELIPSGEFAKIEKHAKSSLQPLSLKAGTGDGPKVTVIVDSGTAREAEVFVAALRDRAKAQVTGGPMYGLGIKLQRFPLPDGSGYTLTAGHFLDLSGKPLVRAAGSEVIDKSQLSPMKLRNQPPHPPEQKK